jgi:DNA-binding CsgD family transcriptional regulator
VLSDLFVTLYVFLFVSTSLLILIYFYRLRQEARNSFGTKKALDDIIISFNKDLESERKKILELEKQEDKKVSDLSRSVSNIESRIQALETKYDTLQHVVRGAITEHQEQKARLEQPPVYRPEGRESYSIKGLINSQKTDTRIPVMPPIPFERENALSPLTNTELQILKLLADEGGKTSSDIKERIRLTREHTARLMKKLYLQGYVERRTEKMPYIYQLKKEMEGLLNTLGSNT